MLTSAWSFAKYRVSTGLTALQLAMPWLFGEYLLEMQQGSQQAALSFVQGQLEWLERGRMADLLCPATQVRRKQNAHMFGVS